MRYFKKYYLLLVLMLSAQVCFGQIKTISLDKGSLPKSISYKGNIVIGVQWDDVDGRHIVLTTETGEIQSPTIDYDDGYRDAALYGYHYFLKGDSVVQTWKIYDFVKECPVDIRANYIKNTFQITDIDKNGKAEVWLMYKTVCHGDVSPSDMKIIMYEDDKKYAVRGTNRVKFSETEFMGGEYTFDEAFKKAPKAFKLFAEKLWKKNIDETWE